MGQSGGVAGMCNTTSRNKQLQTTDLTLVKCMDMCELRVFSSDKLELGYDNSIVQEGHYVSKVTSGQFQGKFAPIFPSMEEQDRPSNHHQVPMVEL